MIRIITILFNALVTFRAFDHSGPDLVQALKRSGYQPDPRWAVRRVLQRQRKESE